MSATDRCCAARARARGPLRGNRGRSGGCGAGIQDPPGCPLLAHTAWDASPQAARRGSALCLAWGSSRRALRGGPADVCAVHQQPDGPVGRGRVPERERGAGVPAERLRLLHGARAYSMSPPRRPPAAPQTPDVDRARQPPFARSPPFVRAPSAHRLRAPQAVPFGYARTPERTAECDACCSRPDAQAAARLRT